MASADVTKLIDDTLAQHRIVIFSKSYCPYCRKAKQAFLNVVDMAKLHVLEIEDRPDMDAIQTELGKRTGARSVPRVFVDGEFIGGGDETAALESNGQLKQLLESKGIL